MKPYYRDGLVTIYHCSAEQLTSVIDEGQADLVLTDPPYPREYSHVWRELGMLSMKALKPGGMLVAILGHYHLPFVLDELRSAGLEYIWLAIIENHNCPILRAYRAKVTFKPVLVMRRPGDVSFRSVVTEIWRDNFSIGLKAKGWTNEEKNLHEWAQPVMPMLIPIDAFCPEGGLVVDPFLGSGTTAVACRKIGGGRRFIGCDLDEKALRLSMDRLAQREMFLAEGMPVRASARASRRSERRLEDHPSLFREGRT